jgi:hypothetical protein
MLLTWDLSLPHSHEFTMLTFKYWVFFSPFFSPFSFFHAWNNKCKLGFLWVVTMIFFYEKKNCRFYDQINWETFG